MKRLERERKREASKGVREKERE
jgi:hypothetical protein